VIKVHRAKEVSKVIKDRRDLEELRASKAY
jgi:hypothetical protein